jgi:hypothetical protein
MGSQLAASPERRIRRPGRVMPWKDARVVELAGRPDNPCQHPAAEHLIPGQSRPGLPRVPWRL